MAGVMAHEIGHVAARHGTRQATKAKLINIGTIPLIFLGGWTGYAIRQGMGLAIPLGFLTFYAPWSRKRISWAWSNMYKAGYDPSSFVDFFEKIQSLERRSPARWRRSSARTRPPMTASRRRR